MKLKLKNPIVFFDIEATGIDIVHDRIVELSYLKISPSGKEMMRTMRFNPTIPMPADAQAIHGISDDDVKDKPTFKEAAKMVAQELEGCDLAGYNLLRFDLPMLIEEFMRADVDIDFKSRKYIDVQVIFHKMEQRTLQAAYRFYCNRELTNAHTAEADTRATFEILEAQLDKYTELENDIVSLSKFSAHNNNADYAGRIIYNEAGAEVINFGKYKGQLLEEVLKRDPGYYGWIMNGDFPLYTKKVVTTVKLRSAAK